MTASDEQWARPSSVPLPTIWKKYRGLKQMANGKVPTFVIQDVPEDMHDDVLQFMTTHFCRDEVLCESVRILDDPVSVLELQDFWRKLLKQNMGIVALVDDDEDGHRPRIAGCNVAGVTSKDEKIQLDMFKGRCIRTLVKYVIQNVSNTVNVFERYGVDVYMTAFGLCVDPGFRCQGLGLEILRARFDLAKAVGLTVTMTVFTGQASQKLAHRVGMEVLAEVLYDDIREDGNPVFPNIKNKSMKIMARKTE